MFDRLLKRRLYEQIEMYLSCRGLRHGSNIEQHRDWLEKFAVYTSKHDAFDLSKKDIDDFIDEQNGEYGKFQANKRISPFFVYFHSGLRWRNMVGFEDMLQKKLGRPRNEKMIRKIALLRKKGKTYRQIAAVVKKDVKTVYVWSSWAKDLSTTTS